MTGSTKAAAVLTPESGNHLRLSAKMIWMMMATQNDGADMPKMERAMRMRSAALPWQTADTMPTARPRARAKR